MKVNLFLNPVVWENHVPHLRADKHRVLTTHQTWTAGGIEKPALSLLKREHGWGWLSCVGEGS